jgi:DNA end-binding protein Ku
VVLSDEDFERANVKATHTVEILDFVDASEIDPIYFDRPYFLAPISSNSKGYALLRETLRRTGKVGVARVVIRTREYLGAVMARGPMLVLEILRYGHELRSPEDLDVPGEDLKELGVTDKELKMAELLVDQMVEAWTPDKYKDRYRDDLLVRIKAKIAAGETEGAVAGPDEEEETGGAEVVDIMDLLKRSVERAGKAAAVEGAGEDEESREKKAAAKRKARRKTA